MRRLAVLLLLVVIGISLFGCASTDVKEDSKPSPTPSTIPEGKVLVTIRYGGPQWLGGYNTIYGLIDESVYDNLTKGIYPERITYERGGETMTETAVDIWLVWKHDSY